MCNSLKENVRNIEKFYEKVEIYGIVYVKFYFMSTTERKIENRRK